MTIPISAPSVCGVQVTRRIWPTMGNPAAVTMAAAAAPRACGHGHRVMRRPYLVFNHKQHDTAHAVVALLAPQY